MNDVMLGLVPSDGGELILYLALGFVLPSLVALVTKRLASGQVKSVTLIALSVIGSVLTELAQTGLDDFNWKTTLSRAVALFYIAVGTHFGILKGAVTGANGTLAQVAPERGIGTPQVVAVVQSYEGRHGSAFASEKMDGADISFTDQPGEANVSEGIKPATDDFSTGLP